MLRLSSLDLKDTRHARRRSPHAADLMEKAIQEGRPRLNTLPYAAGRQAVDKMSEDSEADPPDVGEITDGAFAGPGGEIRFRRYRPHGAAAGPLPTLIYYHGGGS